MTDLNQLRTHIALAEIAKIKIEVAGMEADNQNRVNLGQGIAWPGHLFVEASGEIENYIKELQSIMESCVKESK